MSVLRSDIPPSSCDDTSASWNAAAPRTIRELVDLPNIPTSAELKAKSSVPPEVLHSYHFLIAITLVASTLALVVGAGLNAAIWVALTGVLCTRFVAAYFHRKHMGPALDRAGTDHLGTTLERVMIELYAAPLEIPWRIAAKKLVANGFAGRTALITNWDDRLCATPFTMQFTPLEINDGDDVFLALRAAADTVQGESSGSVANRRRRRLSRRVMFAVALVPLFLLCVLCGLGAHALWTGKPILPSTIFNCLSIGELLFASHLLIFRRSTWYVAPQRLIERPRLYRFGTKPNVFDRSRSVLLVSQRRSSRGYYVCVANDLHVGELNVTIVELEVLLRAWLSPVTPPPVDQLSDFE